VERVSNSVYEKAKKPASITEAGLQKIKMVASTPFAFMRGRHGSWPTKRQKSRLRERKPAYEKIK
jgi:hypothetical protein